MLIWVAGRRPLCQSVTDAETLETLQNDVYATLWVGGLTLRLVHKWFHIFFVVSDLCSWSTIIVKHCHVMMANGTEIGITLTSPCRERWTNPCVNHAIESAEFSSAQK